MIASLVVLAFVAAAAPVLCRYVRPLAGLITSGVVASLGILYVSAVPGVVGGEPRVEQITWITGLGLDFAFRLDGLSLTFALLICFIGAGVLLYTSSYMAKHPRMGVFMLILTSFMVSMLGLVLADNLLLLFIFWELTSITSFLLIGFDHTRESARKSAVQALLTTGLGGLALLAGLILMGVASGTWTLSEAVSQPLHDSEYFSAIAILLMLGSLTKSANFPFHYWLPNAMEAPSPVSALLHSATMVKAGVYLIARVSPGMSGEPIWDNTLITLGGFTMIFAAFLATRQDQIKKILAYSTVSALGTLVMLLGLGAVKAAAIYLLAHAFYKGCLFLVAGSLTKLTGEKNPDKLGGLVTRSRLLTFAAIVGGLSMAGMLPFIGFAAKEFLLKAGLASSAWAIPVTAAAAVTGALTVMVSWLVGIRPFLLAPPDGFDPQSIEPPSWRQLTAPVTLSVLSVLGGLLPFLFAEPIVGSIVAAVAPAKADAEIHFGLGKLLWPPTVALGLSIAALVIGTAMFFARRPYRRAIEFTTKLDAIGPARGYDGALAGLLATAKGHTRVIQNGSLQAYVRIMLFSVITVVGLALSRTFEWSAIGKAADGVKFLDIMLFLGLVASAVAAVMQRRALATVACLSGVGFVIAILFAIFGAPDLAMTQFAVETLMLIIFVLVLFHLPRYRDLSKRAYRILDIGLASVFGILITGFVLSVLANPAADSISSYHAANSLPKGYGRNVVNVILVDFRAVDTLGEVFVIGVAAIGVFTMLRVRAPKQAEESTP
ncbi:MAG: hydrogen gas-evolving membrane-bound hydrogenase subunit E [Planctomycetota bacterium]